MDLFSVVVGGVYSLGVVLWLLWHGAGWLEEGGRGRLLASLAAPLWALALAAWGGLALWDLAFGRPGPDLPPEMEASGWVVPRRPASCTALNCRSGGPAVAQRPSTGEARCASCAAREVEVD